MQRVVLDTNVIVSGTLTSGGPPAIILDAWRQGRFLLIISEAIIEEVKDVLSDSELRAAYPHLKKSHVGNLINLLRNQGHIVAGTLDIAVIEQDEDDDKFVIAAVEGEAQYIVSGDSHLAQLKKYKGIRVISPSAFARRFT